MVKKTKSVQLAEKQKSEESKPEAVLPAVVIAEPQVHVEAPKPEPKVTSPSIMDILQTTDPKMLQTAQQFGLPLKALLEWCARREDFETQVKQTFEELGKKMPTEEGIAAKLMEKAQAQRAQTQQPAAAQGGGISMGDVAGIIKEALSTGGGSSVLQQKMETYLGAVLDKQLAALNQPSKFEQFFEEEMARSKAKAMAKTITSES